MEDILLTFVVSGAVGYLCYRLKVPGGMLIGAIVGAVILSVGFGRASMPYPAKMVTQTVAGAFIGSSIERSDLKQLRELYKLVLVVLSSMLALNIALSFFIAYAFKLDLLTALLSAIPGGVSNSPLIAAEYGADVSKVAFIQFIRLAGSLALFPSFAKWIAGRHPDWQDSRNQDETAQVASAAPTERLSNRGIALVAVVATATGTLGWYLGVPAGRLLFAMLGTLALKLAGLRGALPRWIKRIAQVLSGAYIGCSITYEDCLQFPQLIVPALIVLVGYLVNAWLTGRLLAKRFHRPINEAMLMVMPAGASDMALISSDLGVESVSLIMLQVVRLIAATSLFPSIHLLIAMAMGR